MATGLRGGCATDSGVCTGCGTTTTAILCPDCLAAGVPPHDWCTGDECPNEAGDDEADARDGWELLQDTGRWPAWI